MAAARTVRRSIAQRAVVSAGRRAAPVPSGVDRSFPLRVAPIDGEALDSWLDAIAHRHHVPRGAILERCAIAPNSFYGAWMRLLSPADIDGIAQATGYGPDVVDALALPRTGSGAGPLSGARTLPSSTWDWRASSRWCPYCLTDTGGRWMLAWRLNWTFACPAHHCLLQDRCPSCDAPQRRRAPAYQIPQPGRCAQPTRDPHARRPCNADLGRVQEAGRPLSSFMARTQRLINALLAGQPSRRRVYGSHQPPPHDILIDLKTIARYISTLLGGVAADPSLPSSIAGVLGPDHINPAPGTARPTMPSATQTAKASTIAAAVLDAHDPTAAQHLLTLVILAAGRFGSHRMYNDEALTPLARLIYQRASQDARTTLKLRRRFDTIAAKSTHTREKSR